MHLSPAPHGNKRDGARLASSVYHREVPALDALERSWLILATLLGLSWGSFASVLVHRIPQRQPWIGGRSRCAHCGHALAARDLIPLLSWLWLRGRCRYCGVPVHWRYPLLEAAFALAAVSGYLAVGWPGLMAALALLTGAAVAIGKLRRQPQGDGDPRKNHGERGATLLEAVCALLLVSVTIGGAVDVFYVGTKRAEAARVQTVATNLIREDLATARGIAFDDIQNAVWPSLAPPYEDYQLWRWVSDFGGLVGHLKEVTVEVRYRPGGVDAPGFPAYRLTTLIAREGP